MKEIKELPKGKELLSYLDVVIDGPFVESLHRMDLKWKRVNESKYLDER